MNAKQIVNRLLEDYDPDLAEISPEEVANTTLSWYVPTNEVFMAWCALVVAGGAGAERLMPGLKRAVYNKFSVSVDVNGYFDMMTDESSSEGEPIGLRFYPELAHAGELVDSGDVEIGEFREFRYDSFVFENENERFFGQFEPASEDTWTNVAKEASAFIKHILPFYKTTEDIIEEFK